MLDRNLHHSADDHHRGRVPRRARRMSASTRHFVRHYAEMVVAMFLGMAVLGIPAGWAMGAVGTSWSELTDDAPALMFLGMATTMTVPMVAWMRYRGHAWRPNAEMAASMYIPTFAAIALLPAGVHVMTAMGIQHVLMFPAMLGAMLLRPAEYAQHHHDDAEPAIAAQVTA
jgi:hypothetical protein